MIFMIFILSIAFTNGFSMNGINIHKKMYNNKVIKIYEPKGIPTNDLDSIIFFTGGNSIIPADIYSTFINYLVDFNYSVSVVSNNIDSTCSYLRDIKNKYSKFHFLSHSSGTSNAIEVSNRFLNTDKAIFLDPVDNSRFIKTLNNDLIGLKDILVITAEKSYDWSIFPFKIPFIPAFRLDIEKLKNKNSDINVNYVSSYDNGHTDVLDSLWSDLMHSTISKGTDDRSEDNLNNYKRWLVIQIHNFICGLDTNNTDNENFYLD